MNLFQLRRTLHTGGVRPPFQFPAPFGADPWYTFPCRSCCPLLFGDSKYTKNDASLLPLKARFHPQDENGNRTISPKNKGGINIPPVQLPHLG